MPNFRPASFIIASTNHGTMILNRNDFAMHHLGAAFGVGHDLLTRSEYDMDVIDIGKKLLSACHNRSGDGVVAIDVGANIGVFTVEWAKHMTGWGSLVAVEAQERVFYALCGNIAINNLSNARAVMAAVSDNDGTMIIPVLDHDLPASFGSLELTKLARTQNIGQQVSYATGSRMATIATTTIDELDLPRIDFIKLDIEGMEIHALRGAKKALERCHPILLIESIKINMSDLIEILEPIGYLMVSAGANVIAVHSSDPAASIMQIEQ